MLKSIIPNSRPAKKARTAHFAASLPTAKLSKPKTTSNGNAEPSSGSQDRNDDRPGADKSDALAALEAHSRMMLGLMGGGNSSDEDEDDNVAESSAMAIKRGAKRRNRGHSTDEGEDASDDQDGAGDEEGFSSDDGWGAEDGMVTDSEEEEIIQLSTGNGKAESTVSRPFSAAPAAVVPEVVFADMGGSNRRDEGMTKAERKAFMSGKSSKIMGLAPSNLPSSRKRPQSAAEDLEDATNSSLDTTLHKMLLQNLLPSASSASASRPVDKRNAMSGRLLELAQISLPGEGTSSLPSAMHSRHSAKIRTGIIHAKAKRDEKAREASEAAGSWVRGKGGLGDIGKRGKGIGGVKGKEDRLGLGEMVKKKGMSGGKKGVRERGLDASVGKFEKGSLRVDARTIARVERQSQKSGPVMPKGKGKGKKGW